MVKVLLKGDYKISLQI